MNKNVFETVWEFWTEFGKKQYEFQNEKFWEIVKFNYNLLKQWPNVFNYNAWVTNTKPQSTE